MAEPTREIKDAPIANTVDPNSIKERLKQDNFVTLFSKLGTKMLEDTNKPNVITLEQFQPFIPLFNMNKELYEEDESYRLSINRLYNQFIRGLNINLYQPTIVIRSREDPTECYFLNRRFTRIKSDGVEGKSMRDTVPAAVSKAASTTRDQLILEASVRDLIAANSTPEQKSYFTRIRMESALIEKNFVERNLSPEKRQELINDDVSSGTSVSSSVSNSSPMIFDDDD